MSLLAARAVAVPAPALCRLGEATGGSLSSPAGCFRQPSDFSPFVWAKTHCCWTDPTVFKVD